mmetsp:Transcript_84191/g.167199  ORF Transcript_84191/g.167199 Transcript_84191/m.167199 type:complete len:302 (+) Transcript_84191:116-1021(+)
MQRESMTQPCRLEGQHWDVAKCSEFMDVEPMHSLDMLADKVALLVKEHIWELMPYLVKKAAVPPAEQHGSPCGAPITPVGERHKSSRRAAMQPKGSREAEANWLTTKSVPPFPRLAGDESPAEGSETDGKMCIKNTFLKLKLSESGRRNAASAPPELATGSADKHAQSEVAEPTVETAAAAAPPPPHESTRPAGRKTRDQRRRAAAAKAAVSRAGNDLAGGRAPGPLAAGAGTGPLDADETTDVHTYHSQADTDGTMAGVVDPKESNDLNLSMPHNGSSPSEMQQHPQLQQLQQHLPMQGS